MSPPSFGGWILANFMFCALQLVVDVFDAL